MRRILAAFCGFQCRPGHLDRGAYLGPEEYSPVGPFAHCRLPTGDAGNGEQVPNQASNSQILTELPVLNGRNMWLLETASDSGPLSLGMLPPDDKALPNRTSRSYNLPDMLLGGLADRRAEG